MRRHGAHRDPGNPTPRRDRRAPLRLPENPQQNQDSESRLRTFLEYLDGAPRGCFGLYGHVGRGDHLSPEELARTQQQVSEILARYEEVGIGRVELFAGAAELLRALPGMGLQAGIVSSNPRAVIEVVLRDEGVADCFGIEEQSRTLNKG